MTEPVTWTPPYPGGWKNEPDHTTPIMAEYLDDVDDFLQAVAARANAAYNAAEAAAGGDSSYILGLTLDGTTDDGPVIAAAAKDVENEERGAHLVIHGTAGQVCFIDSAVRISGNRTIITADVPIVFGPSALIRPWGEIAEVPTATPDKPALTADADAGTKVLHVDQIPSDWVVGIYIGLRGKRTASGSVPNDQIFHSYVTAIDGTALTITVEDELPIKFFAVNDTPFSNKESQLTKVLQSPLTGSPDAGDVTITVDDTSFLVVGDVVQIIDDSHTFDDGGAVQDGNFAHKECALVAEILNDTSLKLSHALHHTYDTGANARVQKLDAVRDVQLRNWRVSFSGTDSDNSHAFEVRYAYNCHLIDMHLIGGGDDGESWAGHAIRFTDSLACSAVRPVISNPSSVTAARGYGTTFYGSTGCWVEAATITGCRHSILWFNGAASCFGINCISTDARISDYDWHGADDLNNRTIDCTAVGGTRTTPDSNGRSAWKWGNPSHYPGDRGNVATGCLVVNYKGAAIEGIPTSAENVWQGVVRGADVGIKLGPLADETELQVARFAIVDSDFYDVATPLAVDGGDDQAVVGLVVDGNRWHRCGPFVLTDAPSTRFTRNTIIDPAMGSAYALTATGCDGLRVTGNDFSAAPKGVKLTGCPDARVFGNVMHDLGVTTVLEDGGGNTNFLFRGNDFHPGSATKIDTVTSTGRTVVL